MEKYLLPQVKRPVADYLNQYLEMGTWTVVGDFRRVYRGPNLEYKGWQKSSITTPDALFDTFSSNSSAPYWARNILDNSEPVLPDCSPVESRDTIIGKIMECFPETEYEEIVKLI